MIQTLPPNSGRNWGRTETVLRLAGTEVTKSLHTFELSKVLKTGREPRVLPDTCSNYHMDDCNLSFKFPAVLRKDSVARSDYRRNRQTSMLLLSRASASKVVPDRKSWEPQLVPNVHHKWHTDITNETDLVKAQENDKSYSIKLSGMFLFTFQPNTKQELSKTIRLSCLKDHQKSY